MRRPKTPLMQFLQRAFNTALITETRGEMFAEDLREKKEIALYSRRQFVTQTLGAVAATGLTLSSLKEMYAAPAQPEIAVVGAGLAGLNAAYQLQKAGLRATIYEASTNNSWGRIRTRRIGNNLSTELGGEFIDSSHADMLGLMKEFQLASIDMLADTRGLIKDSYFFRGRHYSEADVIREFRGFAKKIADAADSLPEDTGYTSKSDVVRRLDNTSIEQYLRSLEIGGWLYDLLDVAYTSEFGLEIGDQSALNFITMIGTDVSKSFEIFGESDERYKIKGGNSRLIDSLRQRLSRQIVNNRWLEAVTPKHNGYRLSFAGGKEAQATVLILAIPFTTLRDVDLSRIALPPEKNRAIQKLGYGTNSKLLLNVTSRSWRRQGRVGYLFNEKIHNGWDNTQGQGGNIGDGSYTVFLGGKAGKNLDRSATETYLGELDKVFPTFESTYTNSHVINWSSDELTKGGYACYKVGQWTSISGAEIEPYGNIFFCGEHCSSDYQGYMNGAAETGRSVAENIVRKFGTKARRAVRR